MMFAVASFFAYIWVTYTVPETANVSLEEIDGMFRSSAGREEIAMKRQVYVCSLGLMCFADLALFNARLRKTWGCEM